MCVCLCDVFLIATQRQLKDNDLDLFTLARERKMHEISRTHLIHIVIGMKCNWKKRFDDVEREII